MSVVLSTSGERSFGRRVLLLAGALAAPAVLACDTGQRAPPAAPGLQFPSDAIPPELAWVFRADVGRVRSALGVAQVALLKDQATSRDPSKRFLLDVFERTSVLVVGLRPEASGVDLVIAAEGDFASFNPRSFAVDPPWQAPVDLGGDVRRFDRKSKERSDPARVYLRSNRLLVIVSAAAIDSVEAILEHGASASPVVPPDRGIVSMSYRPSPGDRGTFARGRFPELSQTMESSRSIEAFIDESPRGFIAEITWQFATEAAATHAAEVFEYTRAAFADGTTRIMSLAQHTKIENQGTYVLLRADLVREMFGETLDEVLK